MPRRLIVLAISMGFMAYAAGCGLNGDSGGSVDATEFTAALSGDAERPDPVDTDGTGTGTFTLNEDETELTYSITASGLSGDVTAAHFHLSAIGPDGFGGIVFGISDTVVNDGQGGATAEGAWNLTEDDVDNLRLGYIYVNLHTDANPAGEIRGNLVEAP